MGLLTAWSRCCWVHSVTWVPVPPPIAPTLPCATLRSPHTPAVFPFCHRLLADYRPPIGAARPQICHGPPYRLVTLLLGPQCDMGPCTTSHCSHSAMCHFEVSSHSCWFPFCHRLLYGLPLLLPPPP
ncbi:unnamed protein product, partial [Staurois parvus]